VPVPGAAPAGAVTDDCPAHRPNHSFTQAKGKGHGMHRQSTVLCTAPPVPGTAADFGITGVAPNTPVEFDFSAQVVIKPHH